MGIGSISRLAVPNIIVVVAVSVAGCGGDSFELADVSGKVTIDGSPAASLSVTFQPEGDDLEAPNSYGITDEKGEYQLSIVTGSRTGAIPGKHRISIVRLEPETPATTGAAESDPSMADLGSEDQNDGQGAGNQIPARFNVNSILKFDVPVDGTDQANFELSMSPDAADAGGGGAGDDDDGDDE